MCKDHVDTVVAPASSMAVISFHCACRRECLWWKCTTIRVISRGPLDSEAFSALGNRNCIACKVHLDVFHANATPPRPSSWSGLSRPYPYFDRHRAPAWRSSAVTKWGSWMARKSTSRDRSSDPKATIRVCFRFLRVTHVFARCAMAGLLAPSTMCGLVGVCNPHGHDLVKVGVA